MFTAWFVLSIVFLFTLRGLVMRFLPGETKVAPTDEDLAAYGTVVEVVESVPEMGSPGRIQFQGSGWPALSLDGTLPTGSKVRLVFRENLVWYVEPAGEDALLSDGEPDPFGD